MANVYYNRSCNECYRSFYNGEIINESETEEDVLYCEQCATDLESDNEELIFIASENRVKEESPDF